MSLIRIFWTARTGRRILFAASAALALSSSAFAQEIVSVSPDITIDLGAGIIPTDEDVAVDNQLGVVVLENLGSIPDASDVVALALDVNGDRLIAFDTTTALAGGVIARAGDVIRYDGAAYSIEFDATAAGITGGVATDASSLTSGGLLLSFDTTVDLAGGLVVADEDLVDWDGTSFGLVFDGSAEGVDSALDVDGAQDLGGGTYLLSFDTSGEVGGVVFDDEDVVRFDGAIWSLEFDASAANSAWSAADLDAVMVPEPRVVAGLVAGLALLAGFRRRRHVTTAAGVLMMVAFLIAPVARAADGVAEISEACAALTGCFSGDAAGYPVTIDGSAGGSYRLTSNLIMPDENTDGIVVSSSDIGIDLNNFAIIGIACLGAITDCTPASGLGSGVERTSSLVRGVSVKNGSITGMGLYGVLLGNQAEISGLRVRWNRVDGINASTG
jgi:hypothetical protein